MCATDLVFTSKLVDEAARLIELLRQSKSTIATAESCTGGLLSGVLTEVSGASDVFNFGFVTYSNLAKTDLLGVPAGLLECYGAVSREVAVAMAEGARTHSASTLAIAITGVAGPGGGSEAKPVGLVYIGVAIAGQPTAAHELRLGSIGRAPIRLKTIETALQLAQMACRAQRASQ